MTNRKQVANTASTQKKNFMQTFVRGLTLAFVAVIAISSTVGFTACTPQNKQQSKPGDTTTPEGSTWKPGEFMPTASLTDASLEDILGFETGITKASQTAEYLETNLPRKIPTEVKNYSAETGAVPAMYGGARPQTYGAFLAQRKESRMLNAYSKIRGDRAAMGIYDELDENGYLLKNGNKVPDGNGGFRQIFKHSSSVGLYLGNVADDEPAISKKLSYISRTGMQSNQITGIYAPAGEILRIEMSEEDLAATGGLMIDIGQVYNGGQCVGIEWTNPTGATEFNDDTPIGIKGGGYRIEFLCNSYEVRKTVAYVGSFIGGPVYVRPINNSKPVNFSVTISGGVRYQHFILGTTSPEEYAFNAKSSAPYFDLEVYDNGIRFTSPNKYVKNKTFEDCRKSAIVWEKIVLTSTLVQGSVTDSKTPVVAIFDCYIAAGAAFANPGRNGIVCPVGWMTGALAYESFVGGGSWGVMHEYNHCWQGYGLPGGKEVVNNGVTLVEYMLYTKISAARIINQSLGGWNRLTDPSQALGECLRLATTYPTTAMGGISLYASLLYNLGAEAYIAAARGGIDNRAKYYYTNITNAAHQDFSWFFRDVLHYNIVPDEDEAQPTASKVLIPQSIVDGARAKGYPMFVPVSSVYAVGRTVRYDGENKYIKVAQPFEYSSDSPSGEYTMDFGNRNSFATAPVSMINSGLVIPDGFTVTVKSVTQPKNGTVEMLEDNRVKYTPATSELLSGEFEVTLGIVKNDGAFQVDDVIFTVNLKRNSSNLTRTTYVYETAAAAQVKYNTLVTEAGTLDFGINPTENILNINAVQNSNTDIWGGNINYYSAKDLNNKKVYPTDGTVVQVVSGVLYLPSLDDQRLAVRGRGRIALYLSYDKGNTWELAIDVNNNVTSGNDWKGFKELDAENLAKCGNMVYFKEVLQVSNNTTFCGLGLATRNPNVDEEVISYGNNNYLNAYASEEVIKAANTPFIADYFFKRTYSYTYNTIKQYDENNLKNISVVGFNGNKGYPAKNIIDKNLGTVGLSNEVLENGKTFEVVIDLGENITAHTLNVYSWTFSGKNQAPADFKVYLGDAQDAMKEIATVADGKIGEKAVLNGTTSTITFERQTFRYFKIVVTRSVANHYAAIAGIKFIDGNEISGGVQVAPNASSVSFTGNKWSAVNEACTFGYICRGEKDDFVEFKFTGNRVGFMAYCSADYGTVDLYLDGKLLAENVSLAGAGNAVKAVYVSGEFEEGNHTLKIVGKSGAFNVDSFLYW